jgi:hypothetical protein
MRFNIKFHKNIRIVDNTFRELWFTHMTFNNMPSLNTLNVTINAN